MSLMSFSMVLMSLGVGLEQELGDEFDECLACVRGGPGTARERALSELGGERRPGCYMAARARARAVPRSALRTGHAQRILPHAGGGRRGRSRRAVDSRKIW